MHDHAVFSCNITDEADFTLLELQGQLDALAVEGFQSQVESLYRQGRTRFVLDLSNLTYIGSLGLRVLVSLHNQVQPQGRVVLCNASANIRSILQVTKLDKLFRLYPSRADAIDALKS